MDGNRFDELLRVATADASRRGALRALAAAALAGLLPWLGPGEAEAGPSARGGGNAAGVGGGRRKRRRNDDRRDRRRERRRELRRRRRKRGGGNGPAPRLCRGTSCPQCQVCEATTGECVADPTRDGAPCDDGDACTTDDRCLNGVCIGTPVACTSCQTCNPTDGTCTITPGFDFCVANPSFPPPSCGGTPSEPCICLGRFCTRAPSVQPCTVGEPCVTTAGGAREGTCIDCSANPFFSFPTACAPPCPS